MPQLPLIIVSGLLLLVNAGPVYWQFKQGNSGPISMGVWLLTDTLNQLVNYSAWFSDDINRAPIFCDISIKLQLGAEIGRLAAGMCIARFLACVVSPRATAITRHDRRQRAIFDYSMCFGVPFLVMACHIVYQPNRFLINSGIGCHITTLLSWPSLVLWQIWPPVFAIIGVLYSVYTIYRLIKHRRNFGRMVSGSHSALTTSRFTRLAGLSMAYLTIGLPLAIYGTLSNIQLSGSYSDYDWVYFHSLPSLVFFAMKWAIEPFLFQEEPLSSAPAAWSNVVGGFIFFGAFGLGVEALSMYGKLASKLCFWRGKRASPSVAKSNLASATALRLREQSQNNWRARDDMPGTESNKRDYHAGGDELSFSNVGVQVAIDKTEDIV